MTDHPCKGMTKAQRQWFEKIATGTSGSLAPKKTLDALIERGLVEPAGEKKFGQGPFSVVVQEYRVPNFVHMQWCKWCWEGEDRLCT